MRRADGRLDCGAGFRLLCKADLAGSTPAHLAASAGNETVLRALAEAALQQRAVPLEEAMETLLGSCDEDEWTPAHRVQPLPCCAALTAPALFLCAALF